MSSIRLPFANRRDAGQALAGHVALALTGWSPDQVLVVALSPGGVQVAAEVAIHLGVRLRLLGEVEFPVLVAAQHARGRGGVDASHAAGQPIIDLRTSPPTRHLRPCVVLVDDGIDTGASMAAAVKAIAAHEPMRLVAGAPVASPAGAAKVRGFVDELVTVAIPSSCKASRDWYVDFSQANDADIEQCLRDAAGAYSEESDSTAISVRTYETPSSVSNPRSRSTSAASAASATK